MKVRLAATSKGLALVLALTVSGLTFNYLLSLSYLNRFSGVPSSRKAVVLDPFGTVFDSYEGYRSSIDSIMGYLKELGFTVEYYRDGEVNLELLKKLDEAGYGVVYMNTHGYVDGEGRVFVYTGELYDPSKEPLLEEDLRERRIMCLPLEENSTEKYIAVLPSFIRFYGEEGYGKSLIFIDACFSAFNPTMAEAFVDLGAGCYVGWTSSVGVAFGAVADAQFFQYLSREKDTVVRALTKVNPDPETKATLAFFGDPHLALNPEAYSNPLIHYLPAIPAAILLAVFILILKWKPKTQN